jgi:hypothetical protein
MALLSTRPWSSCGQPQESQVSGLETGWSCGSVACSLYPWRICTLCNNINQLLYWWRVAFCPGTTWCSWASRTWCLWQQWRSATLWWAESCGGVDPSESSLSAKWTPSSPKGRWVDSAKWTPSSPKGRWAELGTRQDSMEVTMAQTMIWKTRASVTVSQYLGRVSVPGGINTGAWPSRLGRVSEKKTPWSESASELYRPSDRRLSVKWLPTFAVRQ